MEEAMTEIASIPELNELENATLRRHSTGGVSMRDAGAAVISRYLKASQGSCHDICKYGSRCNLETESNGPRIPLPKFVKSIRASRQTLERTESVPVVIKVGRRPGGHKVEIAELKLTDRRKSDISLNPSADTEKQKPEPSAGLVDNINTTAAEGEAQDGENDETKLAKGEKKPDVSLKPVDHDCIGREVLLPIKETDVAVEHARDLKLKPQSKPSQEFSRGKQKIEGRKSEGMRNSAAGEKKNVLSPPPKESKANVSILDVKKQKSSRVYRLKQENAKTIKPEKSCGKDAKGSTNSEGASFEDIPEETVYIVEINPENKPEESIQSSIHVRDVSTMSPLASKDKRMNQTRNRTSMGQSPRSYSYENKNMNHGSKGIHVPDKKGLRSTSYGLDVNRQSLTSSSSLASSKLSHSDASAGYDSMAAYKRTRSSRMMYKSRPKWALVTTFKSKPLQSGKLNLQRGKVNGAPIENGTPRRLVFRESVVVDSVRDDSQNGKFEDRSPRRLNFRQRVVVDNRNGDNQNGRGEDVTPRRLKFRERVLVADNQNGRSEENAARRLKFKQRVLLDNRNANNQNGSGEDIIPRRLKFKQRVLVDSRNVDNQNGRGKDITPRRLKFKKRVIDSRISDNQNGSTEDTPKRLKFRKRAPLDDKNADSPSRGDDDITPRQLKSWQRVPDDNENGSNQNNEGETSNNEGEGKEEPKVGQDDVTEVQSEKVSLKHSDVKSKSDPVLYNNMIEETATRLVRSRSSKVKALVSAFESVISLLDTNNIN